MLKIKTYRLILLLIIFSSNLKAQMANESFEVLGLEVGLSSNVVTNILKDSEGFMWFGTQEGLNKYDAYNIRTYVTNNLPGSISNNYILTLFEDSNNQIWVGTESNQLNKYNRDQDNFEQFKPDTNNSKNFNRIQSIIELDEKLFLLGTDNGLFSFDLETLDFNPFQITFEKNNSNLWINTIYKDHDKSIWIGSNQGLIHFFPTKNKTKVFTFNESDNFSISNNSVNCILRLSNGELSIGTNEGMNTYYPKTESFTRYYYDSDDPDYMAKSEIQDMVEDQYGNLWIASFGGGLIKAKPQKDQAKIFTHKSTENNSISNDHIYSLLYDENGLLWIGTYGGGVNKLELVNKKFNHLFLSEHDPDKKIDNSVNAIYTDSDFNWYGTNNGLSIYDYQKDTYYSVFADSDKSQSLTDANIFSIMKDHSGGMWIGTGNGGLFKLIDFDPENNIFNFSNFNTTEGLISNEILCLSEDFDKQIWIGTNSGISIIKNNEVINSYQSDVNRQNTLSNNEVYSILQDSKGKIWIGTMEGINLFNPLDNSFSLIQHKQNKEISNYAIYCLYEDKDGFLWAGTDNDGLLRIDKDNEEIINTYTLEDGLPNNVIYGILEDNKNNLWLSSNKGIIKVVKQGEEKLSFVSYGKSIGLITESFNIGAFDTSEEGIMYFGNFEGVTYFHPELVKGNTQLPPVFINDFQLFFKPVPISNDGSSLLSQAISNTQKIVLRHDQNVIRFAYTALNYIHSDANEFAIKMEGLDEDWNYVGQQREAQYLYLPPGDYTFKVKASNNDGLWNETGVAIDISIKPPFTQTFWFYFIVVILLAGIVIWIFNARTKRLRETRNKLEKIVQKRTVELRKTNTNLQEEIGERQKAENELVDKNVELNSALDNLKKTQSQLIDSEKMASLGQLTAGVAHEINNPINFVSGNVVPLKKDIEDILEVLTQYDIIVKKLNMSGQFEEVEALKKEIDFDFVLNEIDNLLDGIGEGASRTAEIVKGLRNFSRLDEHELKYTNINEGIDSTILILHNKLKERIQIIKEYGSFHDIMCYPGQMNQVFMNVLNNAQEAIDRNGEIKIKTWLENHKLFISIKDNGRGMNDEIKKKIFDPFYTTKDVGKGTGLGLSISFGIIEKHNGQIKINSTPGKGTEFIISIPDNLI